MGAFVIMWGLKQGLLKKKWAILKIFTVSAAIVTFLDDFFILANVLLIPFIFPSCSVPFYHKFVLKHVALL